MSESLNKHKEWKGKIEVNIKCPLNTKEDLAICYTPGVADVCLKIKEDESLSYDVTSRGNEVAIFTDGSAILGLGDIGPVAGMPVMEGKSVLFKKYGNINAIPLGLNTKDPDKIVETIKLLSTNFSGINLEDISAPRCFYIEERLNKELDIPVFHDDQHGTSIVVGAAVYNACKLKGCKISDLKVVVNGAGAAGTAIAKFLLDMGAKDVISVDINGIINRSEHYENEEHNKLALITNKDNIKGSLSDALVNADCFIGVSKAHLLTKEMVKTMAKDPFVFALANPIPEIEYEDAIDALAFVAGTGSSKKPNQINNALVFPGLFRGAIDAKAKHITKEAKIAACIALSDATVNLSKTNLLPSVLDKSVHDIVAKYVFESYKDSKN